MNSKISIVIGIIIFLFLSIFIYKSCTKRTYAEIKSQFEMCINSKMMEFKLINDDKADINKLNEIIDYCQSSLK